MMAGSGSPCRRHLLLPARPAVHGPASACCLLLVLLLAAAASATLYVPEPGSRLYETVALAAGGGIGVAEDASVSGNLVCNDDIELKEHSSVTGDVSAAGRVHNRGTVSGRVVERAAPVTLPVLPTVAQARAVANRVFDDDRTFTDAIIDDVVFVAGDVHVRGSLNGKGTIIARGDIELTAVGHEEGDPAVRLDAATRMSLVALGGVRLGSSRAFRGVVVAGHDLELAARARFEGVLVARGKIAIGEGVTVSFARVDQTPPTISALAPPAGSLVANASPAISAALADDLSGIDPATLKVVVDGIDRSGAAQLTASGFTFTPQAPLADGLHTVAVTIQDRAGNPGQAQWSFATDVTPPALAFTSPSGPVAAGTSLQIVVAYADATSGVDLASLRVSLDGADASASCTASAASASCSAPAPAPGSHALAASLRDRAGNTATASLTVVVLAPAPTIVIVSPADGSYSRTATVHVTGTFTGTGALVTVNGVPAATVGTGGFAADVVLAEGLNNILAVATDAQGAQAFRNAIVTLDTRPPVLSLATPTPGLLTNQAQVRFAGKASDSGSGIASVAIAGQPVALSADGQFDTLLPVAEGVHQIALRAVDLAGNEQVTQVTVTRFSVPSVSITSPADLSYVSATTVTVSGSVAGGATVSVNGVPATVAGATFSAAGVPLIEGGNTLTATAADALGRVGIASINVVRDLTAPHVAIYTPAAGATLSAAAVTVTGLVNDIVAGTVNAGNVTVTLNGLPAAVANRSFLVAGVPLQPGNNVLTAVAVDASGNQGQASITVRQAPAAGAAITPLAGSGQTAPIGTTLPQPLVARLQDAAGQPVSGKLVLFSVRGSNGALDGGRRNLAVASDASGQAQVHLTLGTRAGAGNQVVEASAVGFAGPAVFVASALPGAPAQIVVDSGDQQLGVAGQALPRPLVAAVVDAGANRLAGIAATFRVVKGAGHFANGLPTVSVASDSDGRLIVPFVTDATEAVAGNVVEAGIDALPGGPRTSFAASTLAAGDPAQTAVSGVVLDNSNLPVAGVTLRIRDTPVLAATDAQGLFRIAPAPAGTLKLIVDGSTAARPGAWPDLEFDVTTVPGRNNELRMPIYLLPLDLAHGVLVDETHGGKVTLPQLPGFALTIEPGAVTFPGGSRSGVVSVTVVHSDKVPMVPNFGQQPRLIVTIQPAGARFDPPARLTLPNVEGLAPGQVTELYSFDHDLGHFVSIGPATVSDDGTVIASNPGVGILKAGWHCAGFPQAAGSPNACPECAPCTGDQCVPKPPCIACGPNAGSGLGDACDGQGACLTGKQLLPQICKQVTINSTFQTQPCPAGTCGVVLLRDFQSVNPNCDDLSLGGVIGTEGITLPAVPCPGFETPHIRVHFDVTPSNLIFPKQTDNIGGCLDPARFAEGTCTEIVLQSIYLDISCRVERNKITFTTVKQGSSCVMGVDFQKIGN
jgi:hypothetical protein